MSNFRTEINVDESIHKIEYDTQVTFLGSCFADNMGHKFKECRLPALTNPFGVIYNPLSVAKVLKSIIHNISYTQEDLHYHNEVWLSFDHHGSFSKNKKEETLQLINDQCRISHHILKESDFLFITFGTAWVYQLKENDQIVANCHKYPSGHFHRYMLDIEKIIATYQQVLTELLAFNPHLKIVFTVSPVRHWKDGAHGNQISKATLLLAINKLCGQFNNCHYFPAYELLIDDLRDYRFYAEDMLHPNSTAIEYIWDKFEKSFFSIRTLEYRNEMRKLEKAVKHRAFNPATEQHQRFLKNQIEKIERLKKKYPNTNFEKDLVQLRANII
ncbi:GSCFA domain-containing protein [Saccharicrinis fermentans]|uniref:GSCFA family protein n=1 Tax=Saccharicrinis fermentans DSM 9555 = JCM 21142 TaxID=869213 RepID=W7Y627_9BACT|nr:GSCFA domain-containing protein [Saccharicrinis fermentans]GAF03597.1 GSCFA family protein [Saccharicrinis fermentans DSM 9555 = JCM 21142]